MATVTIPAGGGTASFLVSEANGYRSREAGVVPAASGVLANGTVMARVTATGEFVPFVPGGAGGAGTAAGILYEDIDATAAPVKVTLIVRDAEVQRAALKFAGTPTGPEQAAAFASLASVGIALR